LFSLSILVLSLFSVNAFADPNFQNYHFDFHTISVSTLNDLPVFDRSGNITAHFSYTFTNAGLNWGFYGVCGWAWYLDGVWQEQHAIGSSCTPSAQDWRYVFNASALNLAEGTKHTLAIRVDMNYGFFSSQQWRSMDFYVKTVALTAPAANQRPGAGYHITNSNGPAPLEVTFDLSSSTDSDGYITDYVIDFGDGSAVSHNNKVVKHTYTTAGTYTATMTTKDNQGATSYPAYENMVVTSSSPNPNPNPTPTVGIAPIARFTYVNYSTTQYVFYDLSTDSDGTIVSRSWNFGDGFTTTGASVAHTYPSYFTTYNVVLTVTDNSGNTNSTTRQISLNGNNTLPVIINLPYSITVTKNSNYSFTPIATDYDGIVVRYDWDFNGDGAIDYTSTTTGYVSYNYTTTGTYNAVLRVTDNSGGVTSQTVQVTVAPPANALPVVNAGSDAIVAQNAVVNFAGTAHEDNGRITLYEWDFNDDGIVDWRSGISGVTSYIYPTAGTYVARLTVTDDNGLTASATRTITVKAPSDTTQYREARFAYGTSAVSAIRAYAYNGDTGITTITLTVVNLKNENQTVLVRESLPKSIASSIDNLVFSARPDIIYSRDPEFGWNRTLGAFNSFDVSYSINNYVDTSTFVNLAAPGLSVLNTENQTQTALTPTGVDITGFAFGILGNPWFGLAVLIIAIGAFWKKEVIIQKWTQFKIARGWGQK